MHTDILPPVQSSINGMAPVVPAADSSAAAGEESKTPASPPLQQRADHYRQITLVRRQLSSLRTANEAMAALLAAQGVSAEHLANLQAQLEEAEQSIDVRQEAIAAEQAAIAHVQRLFADATESLSVLRQVGRAVALSEAAHTDLHLDEPLPHSIDLFLPLARRSLSRAQQEPYATLLADATYTPARVATALAQVDALEAAIAARQQAHEVALKARQARDRTMTVLRRAMRPLRVQMKKILRSHPEMIRPAGF
ncbi:MAG: hypothetical protein IAE81_03980 [Caldilineaceae bacterium]|nr:hypothetical protein [Caldilineaceae bacterium]